MANTRVNTKGKGKARGKTNAKTKEIEEIVQAAARYYKENPGVSYRAVKDLFKVPMRRLFNRVHGIGSKLERRPTQRRLREAEERAVLEFIDRLDRLGIEATRAEVVDSANYMLKQRLVVEPDRWGNKPLGDHWLQRFLKRHPNIRVVKRRARERERKEAENYSNIKAWFDKWIPFLAEHGFAANDIWNMDETGFMIGFGRDQWVVTRVEKKVRQNLSIAMPQNREISTVIEAISAAGDVIPPMIVLKGKRHMAKWYDESIPLDGGALIGVSDSGYTNSELALEWIKHFHRHTKQRCAGRKRLLLFDNHETHLTMEFIEFADEKGIVLLTLPPDTAHILQPLDVGVFQPYKHHHSQAVNAAVKDGAIDFNKLDFLACISDVRKKTFKSGTITSAFKKSGVYPPNADTVLSKLPQLEPQRPRTPPQTVCDLATCSTPYTIRSMRRFIDALNDRVAKSDRIDDEIRKAVRQLGKAAEAGKLGQILACKDLARTKTAEYVRRLRKEQANRQIQSGGVVRYENGRKRKAERDEQERVKAARKAERSRLAKHSSGDNGNNEGYPLEEDNGPNEEYIPVNGSNEEYIAEEEDGFDESYLLGTSNLGTVTVYRPSI